MEQVNPQARKYGCLKWSCGGCLVLIFLLTTITGAAWWYLSSWSSGDSVWEYLPPSSLIAVEIHDIHGVLQHALQDPVLASIIGKYARQLEDELSRIPDLEYSPSESGQELVELYRMLGFLHTSLAPNLALISLTATDDLFVLAKLPAWARWTVSKEDEEKITFWDGGMYICYIDGWVAVSQSQTVLAEILDNWRAPSAPLGPRPTGSFPYIVAATKQFDSAAPTESTSHPDAPIMLGNPFANAVPPARTGNVARFTVRPEQNEWRVNGIFGVEVAPDAAEAILAASAGAASAATYPLVPAPDRPVSMAMQFDTDRLIALLHHISPDMPDDDIVVAFLRELRGDMVLQADPPVLDDSYLLPAPVMTIGIPMTSAEAVANTAALLAEQTDRLETAPGDERLLSQAIAGAINIEVIDQSGAVGRVIHVPPELANAANPSWLAQMDSQPPQVWLSSDPSGLKRRADFVPLMQSPVRTLDQNQIVNASIGWNMTDAFRLGVRDLVKDRLEMVPHDSAAAKQRLLDITDGANAVLGICPKGTLSFAIEADARTVELRLIVPLGNAE